MTEFMFGKRQDGKSNYSHLCFSFFTNLPLKVEAIFARVKFTDKLPHSLISQVNELTRILKKYLR